jgi:uncharacterized membrane protein
MRAHHADERPSGGAWAVLRRAYAEFLTLPSAIIVAFLLLAVATHYVARSGAGWLEPLRVRMQDLVFGNASATSDLLGTIASGLITVTSITVSLLLVALQQAASALTTGVFDQFLRRRLNQFYFGFFVGLSLFALVTLATVTPTFNPVFGATTAFLLTVLALCLLILLLYTSVNQMRPAEIIEEIHRLTLLARDRQLDLVHRTRASARALAPASVAVRARHHGYVTRIDVAALGKAAHDLGDDAEITVVPAIGHFVSFGDRIAEIRARSSDEAMQVEDAVACAIVVESQRDIDLDPACGIEQLEMIGWTSISSAKSNPTPGMFAIRSLRDILAHWSAEAPEQSGEPPLPIVYRDDTFARLLDSFEDLAIVATESMQHQAFIEVIDTFTLMFGRMPPHARDRVDDIVLRILSGLGDLVLTRDLEAALVALAARLRDDGRTRTGNAIDEAREELARSVGTLESRSTRVTPD